MFIGQGLKQIELWTGKSLANPELIDKVVKDVLIRNNICWLKSLEKAEKAVDNERIPIYRKDVYDIIEEFFMQNEQYFTQN